MVMKKIDREKVNRSPAAHELGVAGNGPTTESREPTAKRDAPAIGLLSSRGPDSSVDDQPAAAEHGADELLKTQERAPRSGALLKKPGFGLVLGERQ